MPVGAGRKFQGATGNAAQPGTAAGTGHSSPANNFATNKRGSVFQGGVFNNNLKLAVTTANVPLVAEPMGAPTGSTVRVRTSDGNAGTMYFAETREELLGGKGVEMGAGFEEIFPYQKGRFWYMGNTVGDSANLSARSQ